MELPKHYTVKEVIEALSKLSEKKESQYLEHKREYNKSQEPYYRKTWFGLYKLVDPAEEDYGLFYHDHKLESLNRSFEIKDKLNKQLKVLKKFPLEAKVKLTVEEVNRLFP